MFLATEGDLAADIISAQAIGLELPVLNQTEVPICGLSGVTRTCTRKGMRHSIRIQAKIMHNHAIERFRC